LETHFVEWLLARIPADPRLEVPPGDDAAVLRPPALRRTVIAVDMLTDGVDFILGADGATAERIGHKALAVNLSDLAAMASRPEAAVVAVALPRHGAAAIGRGLWSGIEGLAAAHGVTLAGGDTNTWDGALVISVTVIGSVAPGAAWRRDGARPGDALVLTGPCGGSLLGRHLDVLPRCREAIEIADRFTVHAAIDISDGLSLDLARLMRSSATRGVLDLHQVPIHDDAHRRAAIDGIPPLDHALTDGEDFELLLAMPAEDARALVAAPPGSLVPKIIGEVTEGGGIAGRSPDGLPLALEAKGWMHDGEG